MMSSSGTEVAFRFDKSLLTYITHGRHDLAKNLLNEHLCKASDDWGTLLHYAVLRNQHMTARHLIELGSDVDYPTTILKRTPLMIAIEEKYGETVQVLLRAGANMYVKDADNVSALQMAVDVNNFNDQVLIAIAATLRAEKNVSIDERVERLLDAKCSLYYAAILLRNADVLKKILDRGIMDVNSKGYLGKTALFAAVGLNNVKMVATLLENGANANLSDGTKTPLYTAAWQGNPEIVKLLLKHNSNPNVAVSRTGSTPLMLVFMNTTKIREKEFDECAELLLRHGAQLRVVAANRATLFDRAISKRSFNKVKLLMSHVAVMEMKFGRSAIEPIMRCNVEAYRPTFHDYQTNYYEQCKRILMINTVVESLTLFGLLTHGKSKMRTYMRNKRLDANLANIYSEHKLSEDYPLYYNILTERVLKATRMVQLENDAIPVICHIFKSNCNEVRGGEALVIAEYIVTFFDKHDIEMLCRV